jgi:hypothetical protein
MAMCINNTFICNPRSLWTDYLAQEKYHEKSKIIVHMTYVDKNLKTKLEWPY